MAVTTYPAPSSGGGAALPLGAVAQVASAYAPYGGTVVTGTFSAGTTYLLTIQGDSSRSYGLYAPNSNINLHDIKGGQTVAFKPTVTETALQVGPHDPYNLVGISSLTGSMIALGGGNGLFVTATTVNNTNGGYIYTSTDSITWTNRTSGLEGSTGYFNGPIRYVNGYYVILYCNAGGSKYLYSSNGTSWTSVTGPANFNDMIYAGGNYVASSTNGSNQIYYSSSISGSWTAIPQATNKLASGSAGYGIAYGSVGGTNYYIAVGASSTGNNVTYSTNLSSWTAFATTSSAQRSICIANNIFMSVGDAYSGTNTQYANTYTPAETGYNSPSSTAVNITIGGPSSTPSTLNGVSYIYGLFTVVGNNTIGAQSASIESPRGGYYRYFTSPDVYTWTIRALPFTNGGASGITPVLVNGICAISSGNAAYMTTASPAAAATIYIHSTAF